MKGFTTLDEDTIIATANITQDENTYCDLIIRNLLKSQWNVNQDLKGRLKFQNIWIDHFVVICLPEVDEARMVIYIKYRFYNACNTNLQE
jgi:hypothetical protein